MNHPKQNRNLLLSLLVLLLLFASVMPLLAQDTPDATAEPAATVEVQPTPAATVEPGSVVINPPASTGGDTTINVNPTSPEPAPKPEPPDFLSGISDRTLFLLAVIGFMILHVVTQGRSTALLAKYVDPELALEIVRGNRQAYELGLKTGLSVAAKTPGEDDDKVWIAKAEKEGYKVTRRPDGGYDLEAINPPPGSVGGSLIAEFGG